MKLVEKNNTDKILAHELDAIYLRIIEKARHDENGVFWEIEDNEVVKRDRIDETIYAGISGILLFLIDYYQYKKNPETLTFIDKSSRWLQIYCNKTPTKIYAFYTGRIGTIYSLIRANKLLGRDFESHLYEKYLKDIPNCITKKNQSHDFLNGTAGIILGLLHIYNETKEPYIKSIISFLIKYLLGNTIIKEEGFFWDTVYCKKGLCGLSHGSSGIGLVLLEVGKYFNNPFLFEIAKRSFDYENQYYDTEYNNWPDFRHGFYDEDTKLEYIQHYENGNLDFFHLYRD